MPCKNIGRPKIRHINYFTYHYAQCKNLSKNHNLIFIMFFCFYFTASKIVTQTPRIHLFCAEI